MLLEMSPPARLRADQVIRKILASSVAIQLITVFIVGLWVYNAGRDRDQLQAELHKAAQARHQIETLLLRNIGDRSTRQIDSTTGSDSPLGAGDGAIYPVWFGTNRCPTNPASPSKGFSTETDHKTHFGRVDVIVPRAHRIGEIGNNFFKRLLRGDLRDDHLQINQIVPLPADDLWRELQRAVIDARSAGLSSQALLFLHGYNTSFSDAAIRAAQIGFDLKVQGGTAFFSWPSLGTAESYAADEATIEASEGAITQFIIDFVRQSRAEKVHLIAHSMGNRGLLRSLQRIASDAENRGTIRFGQIFLAAPDVDRRVFLQLSHLYPAFGERTTLYASNGDLAVYLSSRLHQSPRAGYFRPYTVAGGIDTVAVPDFNIDLLGHAYFAQAEALLHDIHDLMRADAAPIARLRIEPLIDGKDQLWQMRR